jgi:hypothetical protein
MRVDRVIAGCQGLQPLLSVERSIKVLSTIEESDDENK